MDGEIDDEDAPASQPNPRVREGGCLGAAVQWVYLHGNRGVLSVFLLVAVFVVCLLLIRRGLITPAEAGDVTALLSALIGGMLPFITVVLAINQLILSEEFGTTGTFFERLEFSREYRRTIEDHTGYRPSPVEPSEFLAVLIEAKRRTALGLRNVCLEAPRNCGPTPPTTSRRRFPATNGRSIASRTSPSARSSSSR